MVRKTKLREKGLRIVSMKRTHRTVPVRALAAAFVFFTIPSLTSALTIHNSVWTRPRTSTSPDEIFSRATTCGDPSYIQCSASLPSDFCCPSTSTCMALAGNTTALCCPTAGDCSQIEPIPCDISLEDKAQHPAATVMTSALTGNLETCGSKCCPFGYSCSNGVCNIDSDQSAKPSTSSVASSATPTSTESSTGTQSAAVSPTSTADSSPSSTSTADSSGSATTSSAADSTSTSSSGDTSSEASSGSGDSSSKAGVVAGGVVGGIAGIALVGMIILFLVKRERRRKEANEKNGDDANPRSSSSFGNLGPHPEISKPILSEGGTFRSDFTRRMSPTRSPGSFHSGAGLRNGDDDIVDDDDDAVSYAEELDDTCSSMHEDHLRPPPPPLQQQQQQQQIATPRTRAVSSWYGTSYDPNDPVRQSEYQPPVKMPSARAFGGNDAHVSVGYDWLGDRLRDSRDGPSAGSREPSADYINVFADSNALAPSPLDVERRETRFSDFRRQA